MKNGLPVSKIAFRGLMMIWGLLWIAQGSLAANWYVDNALTTGTNLGTSWANAWHSFAAINWNNVQPGDTVHVSGGATGQTYKEKLSVGKSGTAGSGVVVKAARGQAGHNGPVIIDGEKTRGGIALGGRDYVRVEGFEVVNASGHAIWISWAGDANGYGVQIVNNTVHDCGDVDYSGAIYGNVRGGLIEGNHLYNNIGDGIDPFVQGGAIIRNNHIHDNTVDGIKGGGRGKVIIEGNMIHDMTSGVNHGDGIQYMGGCDTLIIRNNIFYNCTQNIYLDTYSVPEGTVVWNAVFIYNNVVHNPDPGPDGIEGFYNGISIDCRYNPIRLMYVYNNTLVNLNNGHGGFGGGGDTYPIKVLRVKNNIFYNSINSPEGDSLLEVDYNLYYNEHRDWYLPGWVGLDEYRSAHPEHEVHGFYADAAFIDFANFDFHLTAASPAVNQGAAIGDFMGIAFDFDRENTARPQGAGWDVGAYEYHELPIADPRLNHPGIGLRFAIDPGPLPLLPNPVQAALFGRYLQARRDVAVYNLAGNSIDRNRLLRPGVYMVIDKTGRAFQKVVIIP